jgi:hypothetical protein
MGVLRVVLLSCLLAATGCSSESDLEAATRLLDDWVAAWNAQDADAVAAVFTEDGVYRDHHNLAKGRDEIRAHAASMRGVVSNVWHGEVSSLEDGVYVSPAGFDFPGGADAGNVEIRLDGHLIVDMQFTYLPVSG